MNSRLKAKLDDLPKAPGVYFHKNAKGEIIYVGKAAVLRNRVRQYFQQSRTRDPKTEALVSEIADTDWMVVDSEIEALFLEAEMIRRYMPRYNILLRDDKSMTYIRIDYDSDFPTVTTTRRPLDDGARYFGPYLSARSVRQALRLLRRIFPFSTRRTPGQKRATLHYHLGLDPGLEEGKTSLEDYRANLRKLMSIIEGKRKTIEKDLERDMKRLAKNARFEEAARARNQLFALRRLDNQVIFSDKEFQDISKDHALNELAELLGLYEETADKPRRRLLRRIEGYDISHMQGTDVVASMVVFTNGVSNKGEYRKFKTKINKNDDFYNMHETITRRLSDRNRQKWGLPDLVLIDGGKGQLDAAIRARDEAGLTTIPFIGLAKREEQVVIRKGTGSRQQIADNREQGADNKEQTTGNRQQITDNREQRAISQVPSTKIQDPRTNNQELSTNKPGSSVQLDLEVLRRLGGFSQETGDFILLNLPKSTNLVKLLQRIRDESHRFAVSYHSVLKARRQTASLLDEVPTIGPATKKKLLKTFGSVKGVIQARDWELEKTIGAKKAVILRQYLRAYKKRTDG